MALLCVTASHQYIWYCANIELNDYIIKKCGPVQNGQREKSCEIIGVAKNGFDGID